MAKDWGISFETVDPRDPTKRWRIGVKRSKLRELSDNAHTTKAFRLRLVQEVVEGQFQIHTGWDRPGKDDCWVYTGEPDKDIHAPKAPNNGIIELPAPPNQMFVIFVSEEGDIADWGWRDYSTRENGVRYPKGVSGEIVYES